MEPKSRIGLESEALTHEIIGAAIEVHSELGPGLLESSYEKCLGHERSLRGIPFRCQIPVPIVYKGQPVDCGYRMDILVDDRVIVELKSVKSLTPIDETQLMTHLKLAEKPVGLLINFNVLRLIDGLVRRANTLPPKPPSIQIPPRSPRPSAVSSPDSQD